MLIQRFVSSAPILLARAGIGRILALFAPHYLRHRGVYATVEEAVASARRGILVGYDNEAVVLHAFEAMSKATLEDYPILFWLRALQPRTRSILDAGGHMGTKYRAFRSYLNLDEKTEWIVYDVPTMVRAGRELAKKEGLGDLKFIDNLSEAPDADILLASGLLQYLDIPFDQLLRTLPAMPRHLLLNKVQTRNGPTVVTLENFDCAEVPYQIRDENEFRAMLIKLGYSIVDEWTVSSLSRTIQTHPHLGRSTCRGYYAKLQTA